MPLGPNTKKRWFWVEGSDVARRIDPPIFNLILTRPPRWCHIHHPLSRLCQFWGKLENPSSTFFQAEQAARSRCVSHADSILYRFCDVTNKPLPAWFWDTNQETAVVILRIKLPNHSCQFWGTNLETRRHLGFEAQSRNPPPVFRPNQEKPSPPVLRPNREKPSQLFWGQTIDKPSTLVLRLNQETHAPHLHVQGADRTQHHPTS
jgi:hypothetical protein